MELTDEYNFILLSRVIVDSTFRSEEILYDDRFDKYLYNIKKNFSSEAEIAVADSLAIYYSQYLSVISKTNKIMSEDINARKAWYENELKPVYNNLRKYKKKPSMKVKFVNTKDVAK